MIFLIEGTKFPNADELSGKQKYVVDFVLYPRELASEKDNFIAHQLRRGRIATTRGFARWLRFKGYEVRLVKRLS